MKVISIGGGPAGLFFSLLLKKNNPRAEVLVFEKNKPVETFGWGVVFSKETLGNLRDADPETYAEMEKHFAYWDDIETYVGNQRITSTGHGFCGLSRRELLVILNNRCRALGVQMHFQKEISVEEAQKMEPQLILAADGVHSLTREKFASVFQPTIRLGKCKFSWLGTDKPLKAFTFVFKETPFGLFQVHAYPFSKETSTWIVECREEVWQRAGLDKMSELESVAFLEELFASDLYGHKLLANKSVWRTFPTIQCKTWRHGNVVLMGDAVHTAHFSIGSGTKLAMEDAISLERALHRHSYRHIEPALVEYEKERQLEALKLQRAAQTSLEWFENSARYLKQDPLPFQFNLLTRSRRITHDNLRKRDPRLVAQVDEQFAASSNAPRKSNGLAAPPAFAPFRVAEMALKNRIVVSPMCQYSAIDGVPNEWHFVHYGSLAVGGAALLFTEMTDVTPEGRISLGCAGLWNDVQLSAWKNIVQFVDQHSKAKIGIQLAHAGRKGSAQRPWEGGKPLEQKSGAWTTLGPTNAPFDTGWPAPREMTESDMKAVTQAFVLATERAERAGFDVVEVHMAHGYLLSSFLSPLVNTRKDQYGGSSLQNRMRFPLEVFDAVRAAWPKNKPLFVRISASDWLEPDGMTIEHSIAFAQALKEHGCDVLDVSSAGNVPESKPSYGRMYQAGFAEEIRYAAGMPVMSVGAIQNVDQASTLLAAGSCDLCAIARGHLSDPYLTNQAAQREQVDFVDWPLQYALVKPAVR